MGSYSFSKGIGISRIGLNLSDKTSYGYLMKVLLLVLGIGFTSVHAQDLVSQEKGERLYSTAIDLMEKKQFGAARANFAEYLKTHTSNDLKRINAEYSLAVCALNLYHGDAEKMFTEFIARYPNHPLASTANFDLANFFYVEKNYKKASGYYAKIDYKGLTDEQQNAAHFGAGYSFFSQKFLKEALDQFNFVKMQGGQYGPAASYYAGFVEYSQGDFENALIDLKRSEQNEAYSTIVPYLIANVYYKKGDYESLVTYTTSIQSRLDIANADEIALLKAEAYYKKKDYTSAVNAYNSYLKDKQDGADKGVLLRAGYSAFVTQQNTVAVQYLIQSFTDKDSIGYYSSYYLGLLYLKGNQKPMALTSFDIARKYKADQQLVEESTFQFAKVAYDMGRPDQAIAEFEKLLTAFPRSAHVNEVKELLSQAYVNANNFNRAIDYIESLPKRSAAVDRAYQKATLLKGLDFFNKDNYDEAVAALEKSLQTPVDNNYVAEASFWSGEALSIQKKYDAAIHHYQRIVGLTEVSPSWLVKARYGMGYCFFNLQQYDKATFQFKDFGNKAVTGNAQLPDGVLRLADCYYISKSYPDALSSYKEAIDLNTSDKDYAHLQSGIIYGILRKYPEATRELDEVIKNYAQSSVVDEAIFQRAQLDFEQGSYASAVAGYTKLLQEHSTSRFAPYAYTRRAASNYNLKDYTKTANDYITVLTQYPNHPGSKDVLLPLQEALQLAGRSDEFDKYLAAYRQNNPDAKGIEAVEFESAKNQYSNQDYKRAITGLINYINQYPASPRLNYARYYLAESYYRQRDVTGALPVYYSIVNDKSFEFVNRVVGRIAELELKLGKYEKALVQFKELARTASFKKDLYTAWNGLMESYYLVGRYDSSKVFAQTILEKGSSLVGAANKATLYLGKNAQATGDFDTAKDEYLTTINSAQDEYGAEAKYRLGELFYQSKDYKQCYETLVSLNTDFASYTEWVGKSYLLLSDNFLASGDSFNAKAVLKSLIDNFPTEEVKLAAKAKLLQIDQTELKQKIKADTVDNDK